MIRGIGARLQLSRAGGEAFYWLGRAGTMNLTQWREGAKGAKMRLSRCYSRFSPRHSRFLPHHSRFSPCHSRFLPRHSRFFYPVIPAKAGIQRVGNGVYAPRVPLDTGLRQPRALMSAPPNPPNPPCPPTACRRRGHPAPFQFAIWDNPAARAVSCTCR